MTRIVADTHVHLYNCYRLDDAVRDASTNLSALAQGDATAVSMLFLTERGEEQAFRSLQLGRLSFGGWEMTKTGDPDALYFHHKGRGSQLYVINGRQIATAERMEVLSLGANPDVPDGTPAREAIVRVLSAGGIPVLPWAPGKWMFRRRRVAIDLIVAFSPSLLLLGDTTLRPVGFTEPWPMWLACRRHDFKVVAGTDPLPFPGEEERIGQYATTWTADFEAQHPVLSVRKALSDPRCVVERVGSRSSLPTVISRLLKNRRAKPQPPIG